jgi:osmotically-inducible protein OsmY
MSDDLQLKKEVLAELLWEPSVSEAHIGVTTHNGIVTLAGHVDSFAAKNAAEVAARRVKGVRAIAQEIEVRLPFEAQRGDEEIASAAKSRLEWDSSVPPDVVKVKVEKGAVTLSGEVDWHYQKDAANRDMSGLFGVLSVSDQITIKPRPDARNISENIRHALERSWFLDPKTIDVSATGGTVKLSGTVHSWHDRQMASSTAWAAPGTTRVENNISIV